MAREGDSDGRRRAALGFLLLLFPLAGLVLVLLLVQGAATVGWTQLVLFTAPLCLIFALLCRSSLYMCRGLHPVRTRMSTLIVAHAVAALAATAMWQLAALGLIYLFPEQSHAPLRDRLPLLAGVGFTYYLLSVLFHYLVLTMEEQHEVEQRMVEAQTLAREAELKALRAQLNPHFLFNALNSITALTGVDPNRAREMTITLSEFLRGSLGVGDKRTIPFSEELGLSGRYLKIELIRFSDRMELHQDIDDNALEVPVPPLLLQPLVENAVKHGVAGLVSDGWVRLTARLRHSHLQVVVENNYDPDAPRRSGGGHGLKIIEQRLATYYGTNAAIRTTVDTGGELPVYRTELRLPVDDLPNEEQDDS